MKLPTLPKLSAPKLAFWKKDEAKMPPPPARHFAPSATDSEIYRPDDTQYAKSNVDMDAVKRRIDNVLDNQKRAYEAPADSASKIAQTTKDAAASAFPKASIAGKKILNEGGDFAAASNSGFKSGMSAAQKKFNATLASTKQNIDAKMPSTSISKPKLPSEIDTWKNDFQLPGKSMASNLGNKINDAKSDFSNAVNSVASSTTAGSDFKAPSSINNLKTPPSTFKSTELAKVNQSLYDSKGRLIEAGNSVAQNVSNSIPKGFEKAKSNIGSAIDNMGSKVKSTQLATNNAAADAVSQFKQAVSNTKNAIPALRPATAPIKNSTFASAPPANSFAPPKAMSAAPAPAAPINNSSIARANTGNAFAPAPKSSTLPTNNSFAPANKGSFYKNGGGLANAIPKTNLQPSPTAPANVLRNSFPTAQAGGSDFGSAQFSSASSLPDWPSQNVAAPVSHVADVDIPANVLTGQGSYAPGSVHELRR